MKAFHLQLQSVFTHLTYLSHGVEIPARVERVKAFLPSSPHRLKYKVHSPLQLYQFYQQTGFKFSDSGTTPRGLAEDIMVHLNTKEDLTVDIDQFGALIVSPKPDYLLRWKHNILKENQLSYEITDAFAQLKINKNKSKGEEESIFVYGLEEGQRLTLSHIRIIAYMNAICRKEVILKERHPSKIRRLLQSVKGVKHLQQMRGQEIQLTQLELQSCSNSKSCALPKFESHPQQQSKYRGWRVGCASHQTLSYELKYGLSPKYHIFGGIFPDCRLDQIKRVDKNFIGKLHSHLWKQHCKVPLHLDTQTQIKKAQLAQQSLSLELVEQLVILSEYLQEQQLIEAKQLHSFLVNRVQSDKGKELMQAVTNTFNQILITS